MATTLSFDKKELTEPVKEAVAELQKLISALNESQINTIPYEDSWTAAQLFRHVAKSMNGMGQVMSIGGQPADRDAGERIPELKKMFLDFQHKMKSPEVIVPEKGRYEKQAISAELTTAFETVEANTKHANMEELVNGLPLGPITKLEILHFTLYHTQRHLHQMRKICDALQNK